VRCGWEGTARERIILVADKRTEEESMKNNVVEAEMGNDSLAIPGGGERTLLLLARNIQIRAQEDAAIDAEDILTQAEEANALDPVG
jgi:hypothetical protein